MFTFGTSRTFYAWVLLAMIVFIMHSSAARSEIIGKQYKDTGDAVVADTSLVPNPSSEFKLPANADTQQQIQLLVDEINRLRAAASRATLIVIADLELADKEDLSGAEIAITRGRLGENKELSCTSNIMGACIFILEPLGEKDPSYLVTIKKKKYETLKQEIRIDPGAVAMIPMRVEMTAVDLNNRINPPPPPE